jgi:hypothetical protein
LILAPYNKNKRDLATVLTVSDKVLNVSCSDMSAGNFIYNKESKKGIGWVVNIAII